jgi:UDP-N-acetylmuramoyl-L-alanyl-D-glutamate--2,6-diaminopimelate ligase
VAVVSDRAAQRPVTVPWVVVEDAREAMAVLSDEFYEHPSAVMSVVGITGTNGKTTTAYLLRALFEAAGMKSGLLGTVPTWWETRPSAHRAPRPRRLTFSACSV